MWRDGEVSHPKSSYGILDILTGLNFNDVPDSLITSS